MSFCVIGVVCRIRQVRPDCEKELFPELSWLVSGLEKLFSANPGQILAIQNQYELRTVQSRYSYTQIHIRPRV